MPDPSPLNRGAIAGKRAVMYALHPIRHLLHPRRFHAFCVGAPKSGTHSVAGLFAPAYRAAHEPDVVRVVDLMCAWHAGSTSDAAARQFLRRRDDLLWLELESSHPTAYFVRQLAEEFPGARFILTIRDCYSWLDSCINHQLWVMTLGRSLWHRMREVYYGDRRFRHRPEEHALEARGLYPLDGYLSFWAGHNAGVLAAVPAERLFVVRTGDIGQQSDDLARFLGADPSALTREGAHLYRARERHNLLDEIPAGFLSAKLAEHCGELMARYFPEMNLSAPGTTT